MSYTLSTSRVRECTAGARRSALVHDPLETCQGVAGTARLAAPLPRLRQALPADLTVGLVLRHALEQVGGRHQVVGPERDVGGRFEQGQLLALQSGAERLDPR